MPAVQHGTINKMSKILLKIARSAKTKIKELVYRAMPRCMARKYWTSYGKIYMNSGMSEPFRLMYEELSDLCIRENPLSVLEYGCGYGNMLKKIAEKNGGKNDIKFCGTDFSETQIENARKYFEKGEFLLCDMTEGLTHYKDDEFDVVVGVGVLMYIHPKFIAKAISGLRRICRRKIFIAEYFYKYLSDEKKRCFDAARFMDGRYGYDYEELLKEAGFKNVKVNQFNAFADPEKNTLNEMPHTLMVANK